MDYGHIPAIANGLKLAPEAMWVLWIIGLLIVSFFVVGAVLIHRQYEAVPQGDFRIPPIPQRMEYDSSVNPETRMQELRWIEELMDAPAYGETALGRGSTAGEIES